MARKTNPNVKALQSSNRGMLYTILALVAVAALILGGVVLATTTNVFGNNPVAGPVQYEETVDDRISVTEDGVIAVGSEDAPTIQVWEDFMCPACQQFEQTFGPMIKAAVDEGELRVEYHMLNFLDRQSGSGKFSTRAIAATQCAATLEELDVFFGIKDGIFANQPAEGGGDISARQLADIATEAGGSESADCISSVEDNDSMDKAENTAQQSSRAIRDLRGSVSTPVVAHEGEEVDIQNPTWLNEIIGA